MGKEPLNITRLIRLNDKYAAAESHQRGLARGNQAAEWHGNVYKRANATPPVPSGQKSIDRASSSKATVEMHDEMLALRKTMLRERQAALKQLLESERLMFEEELNAMGLAIDKYSF